MGDEANGEDDRVQMRTPKSPRLELESERQRRKRDLMLVGKVAAGAALIGGVGNVMVRGLSEADQHADKAKSSALIQVQDEERKSPRPFTAEEIAQRLDQHQQENEKQIDNEYRDTHPYEVPVNAVKGAAVGAGLTLGSIALVKGIETSALAGAGAVANLLSRRKKKQLEKEAGESSSEPEI